MASMSIVLPTESASGKKYLSINRADVKNNQFLQGTFVLVAMAFQIGIVYPVAINRTTGHLPHKKIMLRVRKKIQVEGEIHTHLAASFEHE